MADYVSTGVYLYLLFEFVLSLRPLPATLSHLRCIKYLGQHNELQVCALVRNEWRAGHLLFAIWRQRKRAGRELGLVTAQHLVCLYCLSSKIIRSPLQ